MTIDIQSAADRINTHPDLTARVWRDRRVYVDVYGREAGYVDAAELAQLDSPTGWGKHLRRGKQKVWKALNDA